MSRAVGKKHGYRIANYGHAGDGNAHMNVLCDSEEAKLKAEPCIREIMEKVVAMDNAEVVRRLRSAGYDRGKVTLILAPRLRALMMKTQAGALDELSAAVENRDFELANSILLPVPGIGPRVVETAWLLLRQS